jgi:hypothetical protein
MTSQPIDHFVADHSDTLKFLARVDAADFSQLASILASFPDDGQWKVRTDIIAYLATEFYTSDLTPSWAQDVVDMALNLVVLQRILRPRRSDEDLCGELAAAFGTDDASSARDLLAERLRVIISTPAVRKMAGIEDLVGETDRLYRSARAILDARPVYEDVEGLPEVREVLVLHSLRLKYWEDGEDRVFTVVLRDEDVRDLKDELLRAELKAESLERSRRQSETQLADD